ncbi:[2,4-di-O-methyl-alpha-L-fucopyranosyl-(1-_3)-alpha-L-rhamnopyranosyl-(1-_3)-2-O-methyl-alpha-L-rhamnopyranosyl] dimycocerosyl phenol-phthiocerol 3'''-O-methyltransferase [soil metagenome]
MRLFPKKKQTPEQQFHGHEYLRHNARRQEHLATLGLDLANKTVLEVGAGIGDHTTFFLDRGCTVTSTEPRDDNLAALRRHFKREARVTIEKLDLDAPPAADLRTFDIVYAYGVLYHLARPEAALAWLCGKVAPRGVLLLELCVSFGDADAPNLVAEDPDLVSQAITGTGCRPTRTWVMNRLRMHLPHAYCTATQPWHSEFPLNWLPGAKGESASGLTRAVFVGSRIALDTPLLRPELPHRQSRC